MKPTKNRPRDELTKPLDRSTGWRILAQGQVRSEPVVVSGIGLEDSAQMVFAKDHDVIQALPTDRTNQPFRLSILPR
jgi:hypothetical protein